MMFKIILNTTIAVSLSGCGMLNFIKPPVQDEKNEISEPSSLPPEGYIAENWVDSRGCEYLRVANNNWAPKVSRSGSHQCNGLPESTSTTEIATNEAIDQKEQPQITSQPSNIDQNRNLVQVNNAQPIVQIGIFSLLQNAVAASAALNQQGYDVITQTSADGIHIVNVKTIAGQTEEELLAHVKELGFSDAFISYV